MGLGARSREWSFGLRQRLAFSFPVVRLPGAGASLTAIDDAGAQAKLGELRTQGYDLDRLARAHSQTELQEALYVLDLYDRLVLPQLSESARRGPGLDVGAKNGSHLPALSTAIPGRWLGVELDGRRRYLTGVTREGHARHLCREFPATGFRVASVLELDDAFSVVHWCLPFVRMGALDAWGLPHRFFEPAKLLSHVWRLVRPGGALFVVNQGEEERDAQRRLFAEARIDAAALGEVESVFSPFRRTRFGWLATKAESKDAA